MPKKVVTITGSIVRGTRVRSILGFNLKSYVLHSQLRFQSKEVDDDCDQVKGRSVSWHTRETSIGHLPYDYKRSQSFHSVFQRGKHAMIQVLA